MPRLTLQRKIFLALLSLLLVMVGVFMGMTRWGLQHSLGEFVAEVELQRLDWLVSRLAQNHDETDGWGPLAQDPEAWEHLLRMPPGPAPEGHPYHRPPPRSEGWAPANLLIEPPRREPPPEPDRSRPAPYRTPAPDALHSRLTLLDASRQQRIAGAALPYATSELARMPSVPIVADGKTVGYLALQPSADLGSEANQAFMARQLHFALWAGLSGLVLALLMSWQIGRRWFRPVAQLMAAARAVAQGQPAPLLPTQGRDELALLVQTFNDMNRQLNAIEASRQRWLGDVAHELRTPLAALRAEIEALQDGVRPFTQASTGRLHRQVMRLGQLVDDLRLSLDPPDSLVLQTRDDLAPLPVLAETVSGWRERFNSAGLALEFVNACGQTRGTLTLNGDERRLHQIFSNLMENSVRYTQRGGLLRITAQLERASDASRTSWLQLHFDDSAPAPAAAELPRLTERFFRAESSRNRALGGSGLGLSICQVLVKAHGGHLSLALSPLGGLRVVLSLPVQDEDVESP